MKKIGLSLMSFFSCVLFVMMILSPVVSTADPGGEFNNCLSESYSDDTHTNVQNNCGEPLHIVTCLRDNPSNCRSWTVESGESQSFYSGKAGMSIAACRKGKIPRLANGSDWVANQQYYCK